MSLLIPLIILAVLIAFFRPVLVKVIGFLIVEIALFALVPDLLVKFTHLVTAVRDFLT